MVDSVGLGRSMAPAQRGMQRLGGALIALSLVMASLITLGEPAEALTEDPAEIDLNIRFIDWVERVDVVHIFYPFEPDDGNVESPVEVVAGDTLLFGYEVAFESIEDADEFITGEDHDVTVSVDGGPAMSIKTSYQDAFDAEPGVGPSWSWDHDNDGLGDGNENGVADWDGPVAFLRYESAAIAEGSHAFTFVYSVASSEFELEQTVYVDAVDACDELEGEPCAFDPCVDGCDIVVRDDDNGALAEFSCDECTEPVIVTTLPLVDDDVAAFEVLTGDNKDAAYVLVVTMDKGEGPPPGKASVLVIPDDGSDPFVLPKCKGGDQTDCATIKRVKGARTQYTVYLDFDPGVRFR